jgi:hypothetical protein
MIRLMLVGVAKDGLGALQFQAQVRHCVDTPEGTLIVPYANTERKSLAAIGNEAIALGSPIHGILGLCHADCTFGPGALESFAACAAAGKVCGIVGIDCDRNYRWSNGGERGPGLVSTLDSCCVFMRADLGLRFDETTFDGLHCHVEDLCLQAAARGIPVVVPAADASHVGASTFNPEWQAEYRVYRERLARKWEGTRFETT